MIMKNRMIVSLLAITLLAVRTTDGGQVAVDDLHAQWSSAPPAERIALQQKLDRVCHQKDCHASRLFWHTDLESAKAEAQRRGVPILSLHLLGRLDEELSCANSRFFRTLLYSDPAIASLMRDGFVLHWHSVREVPRVTIELGGGRVIRQTITGNSAHYLLDAHGVPLDVLPGLYSPAAFRDQLERWCTLNRKTMAAYHRERLRITTERAGILGINVTIKGQQPVWTAQRQAQSKAMTETRVLRQLRTGERSIERQMEQLAMIGEQGQDEVEFSEPTLALMRSKQRITSELLDNLRRTVAADTAFNEYDLHRRIHAWFAGGEVTDLFALNERVYEELFKTPSSDPWLGLKADSVFMAMQ